MPATISSQRITALSKDSTSSLEFLWITARNRSTNADEPVGFCSDEQSRAIQVISPVTGTTALRSFYGAGGLIEISEIALTLSISVQTCTITLSQIDDLVIQAIRTYDLKMAPVEIYTAVLDLESNIPVSAPECDFYGFVNDAEITTPEEGEAGSVVLTCVSSTQEFVRSNPEVRSHESQSLRTPAGEENDDFYKDASTAHTWQHFWGAVAGTVATQYVAPKTENAKYKSGGSY